jgi:hypothetical protein
LWKFRFPEGKRPLERPRSRWEDEIRMDLRESGWGSAECIQLAQDRDRGRALVNTAMNLPFGILGPVLSLKYTDVSEVGTA